MFSTLVGNETATRPALRSILTTKFPTTMAIKPGSFVGLKAAGFRPSMSVQSKELATGLWLCQWYDKDWKLCEGKFAEVQLIETDSEGRPVGGN